MGDHTCIKSCFTSIIIQKAIEKFDLDEDVIESLLCKMLPYMRKASMGQNEIESYVVGVASEKLHSHYLQGYVYLKLGSILSQMKEIDKAKDYFEKVSGLIDDSVAGKSNKLEERHTTYDLLGDLSTQYKKIGDLVNAVANRSAQPVYLLPTDEDYYYRLWIYAENMRKLCFQQGKKNKDELIDYIYFYFEEITYRFLWYLKVGMRSCSLEQYDYLKRTLDKQIGGSYNSDEIMSVFYNDKEFMKVITAMNIEDKMKDTLIDFHKFLFIDLLQMVGWPEKKLLKRKRDFEEYRKDRDHESFDILKHSKETIVNLVVEIPDSLQIVLKRIPKKL